MTEEKAMSGAPDEFDPPFLAHYFGARMGCDEVRVRELVKFPRGVSRETWFFSAELVRGGVAGTESFVLRRDLPGGSICLGDLRSEYEIYRRLNGSGVPVAETLWYEDDPRALDGRREFFVRRHVEGSWEIPHLFDPDPRHDELRVEIGREHVRRLALLHGCDWRALGFGEILDEPPTPDDCAIYRVRALTDEIRKLQVRALPLVTEAAEWLIANRPKPSGRVCLVKGTNGYGEEVFRGREIVAMSDWELCCLGDPAMDFAMAQEFFADVRHDGELVWSQGHALDYYRSLTDVLIRPETIDYYRRLYGLYRIQYSQAAARQLDARAPLCRLAWIGVEVLHLGQTALANAVGWVDGRLPEMGQR